MKLCFIFDVRFTKYRDAYYSINLSRDFWDTRYLKVFDEIVVVGRYQEADINPEGKLVRSDSEKVKFDCILDTDPFRRMLNWKKEEEHIARIIADCDAVICRGWWGVDECIKQNKKYLIEVVSCYWDAYWNHGLLGKLIAPYQYWNMKKRVRMAPYVIYVTNSFLQRRYPTKGKNTNISNVLLDDCADETIIEQRMKQINANREQLIIGTAAAVNVRYKGQENVIKALQILKAKGLEHITYRLLGSGDPVYLQQCAKKYNVEEMVDFCGAKPHDEVNAWLDDLDIYIQPSLQEGLPRSVIEAMSRGLPCIGTRTGGIPELIDEQWICNKGHTLAKEIAQRIEHLFDPETRKKCALKNYKEAKKYTRETLEKKRYGFLRDFIKDDAYE